MSTRASRILFATASLVVITVMAFAQNQQTQAQPAQNQQQTQPQNQPAKKKSFWDKIKNATQNGQNAVQNGQNTVQNTVQQGQSTVQQGAQQVQGVQNGVQGMVQQGAQLPGSNSGNAASLGQGAAASCGATCFDAGPFQANVSQMTMAQQGGWHVIRMNIQFHNSTDQPLIIAYRDGSMSMVDNNGAAYVPAGGASGPLQGMGIDRGNQTDSSFVLGPGQTGNAMFSVARGRGPTDAVGTAYAYNLTIDELQPQNGAMAIPVRQYNINFPSLTPGSMSAFSPSPAGGTWQGSPVRGRAGALGTTGTNYAGTAVPQSDTRGAAGQRGVAVMPAQQRVANGRGVSTPAATSANAVTAKPMGTVVNNAALKSPAMAAPARTAAKPNPATGKASAPLKKTTNTTTNNNGNTK